MDRLDSLVVAARAGGDWAFACLWEELSGPVAGYLRARGVRDVDDETSEVFLAAFQAIRTFEGDGSRFRSWLFTIAHHRGVDNIRRQIKTGRDTEYADHLDSRTSPSAEASAVAGLARDDTDRLLATLTPDQRDVLLLRFVADLSLDEVADITGRNVGAVKQLQRRGVERLRRHLNGAMLAEAITSASPLTIADS